MANKKSKRNRLTLLIVLTVFVAVTYFFNWYFNRPSFIHYPAFGIPMPTNYAIHGIDVSRYQKTIGWRLLKEMQVDGIKIDFVFMKATEGISGVDKQFSRNWAMAEKHEVIRGAYHFFIPGKSGKQQAENFIKTVRLKKGDLPPVLDVEQTYGVKKDALQKQVMEWVTIVEKKYGVKPIIYTNASFYETLLSGTFDTYPLWVAHYLQKERPRISRKWHFWQHSETGRVNGIDAFVDFNVFNGNSIEFENLLIQ
ncbi:MAG: glycoside hydrolase family 25 protein [Sphingobacteriales bacterium]|nr:MAG: glycoside hydrolase family 25 protein [Sphingobacteriales bacterium]